ncbi:hypothetical protein YN1_0650 [Nanoarchaeota archaeon]
MNILKEMIKSKIGIILLIIFAIIGYLYIKSILLGLLIEFLYIQILTYIFVILFSLNFSLIFYIIIKYRKFYKNNLLSFISALFGFAGLQGCLVACSTGSFAIILATVAPIFSLDIFEMGVILLIVSDILFAINLYFLLRMKIGGKKIYKLKLKNDVK